MSSPNLRYLRLLFAALPVLIAIPVLFMLPPLRQPELVPTKPAQNENSGAKQPADNFVVNEQFGLRHAPGFKISLYANSDLANDIYSMTLDKHGRVVVTSQGWIKILHDDNNDDKADRATVFGRTGSGGMGMNFDGNDLLFMADGALWRYRDNDGNGEADGEREKLFPISYGEHGGHIMRKGPDGCWYMINGNDAKIDARHVTTPDSPIKNPETGTMIRLTPDCKQSEVIAHGFRNPYRFDFNSAGEMFTYDSDVESDLFLPYYSHTRMYHIAHGAHHGWRMTGWKRSYCRPDYYFDTVNILWNVGRGSPTGVMGYRHEQFPAHYRDGIFAQDWTAGKIYFFKLEPDGATYKTKPEIFIEPTGTEGFAPTDMVVRPDGKVYISIGGRKTRGAVFLMEYVGSDATKRPAPATDLDAVLNAHQPLEAWSRDKWVPLAQKLGAQAFIAAVEDDRRDVAGRVRAIEVLTELFGGVTGDAAKALAGSTQPEDRARLAWSLGRAPKDSWQATLLKLAMDNGERSEIVRCRALEALRERVKSLDAIALVPVLIDNMAAPDRRVRLAATELAAVVPDAAFEKIQAKLLQDPKTSRLQYALALHHRLPQDQPQKLVIEVALSVLLEKAHSPEDYLSAIRLIMLGLGDWNLPKPPIEVYTAYSLPLDPGAELAERICTDVRQIFPSNHAELDTEAARLLAMLEDNNPTLPSKLATFWTDKSSPTDDFHYLVCLSRLKSPLPAELVPKIAQTLASLNGKLEGMGGRNKQNWNPRLNEVVAKLAEKAPALIDELLKQPQFPSAGHVDLAASLPQEQRARIAALFLAAVKNDESFPWSDSLVSLLSSAPEAEFLPILRKQWSNFALRDRIVHHLASRAPEEIDRKKYLAGVESTQQGIIEAALKALENLPRDPTPKNLIPLLKLLRKYTFEPGQRKMRAKLTALINRQLQKNYDFYEEEKANAASLKSTYAPIFDEFLKANPALAEDLNDGEDPAYWTKLLKDVPWDAGDATKGEVVFRERACQTCHAIAGALGPSLNGAANRFSKEDLLDQIIYPSRNVADNYRTTFVRLKDGSAHTGIMAFGAADMFLMQTGATTTVRIPTEQIVEQRPSTMSLMPNNLLKDLPPADIAHLYAYLRSLK